MVSKSVYLMTVLDLIILGVIIYAMAAFFGIRWQMTTLRTRVGFTAIMAGLVLTALFYLADLLTMYVLPSFIPRVEVMSIMNDLHLNQRWWVSLASIGAIAFGLSSASKGVFSLVGDLRTSREELQRELQQRCKSERALQESESALKRAQKVGKIGHWRWSIATNKLVSCSEEFARIHGVGLDDIHDLMVKEMECVIHPQDRARVAAEYARVDGDGTDYEVEYRIIRADGEVRHLVEIGEVVFDEGGQPIEHIGTLQDITARKQAEEALRKSEAELAAIMENAPAEIYLKDAQGRYLRINRQYERLWGVTSEAVVGRLPEAVHSQKEFATAARAHDLAVLESGEVIEQEHDVHLKGGWHALQMVKFPIRNAAGEIVGLGAIATDVTERRRLQQIKNEFISSVSHELRTPMTSVVGALGLVQSGSAGRLPEKAQSMIEIAHRNCNRLVRLLNDILDIERIESGKASFEFAPLELRPLIQDSIESVYASAAEQDVTIGFVADAADLTVRADGDRLVQVLINLLSNAIKFSPRGGIVDVHISQHDRMARVTVSDQGPGIPEAFHDRVFERFAQADASDSRSKAGSGLGLSISKLIIDAHGGTIAFDTLSGGGTRFSFELPELVDGADADINAGTDAVANVIASY